MDKTDFTLKFPNYNIPNEDILSDMIELSSKLNKSITYQDYNKFGKYSSATVKRNFGTWNKAKELAGLTKNIEYNKSNDELFNSIKHMWLTLGRQPQYRECRKPFAIVDVCTYVYRFGSWKNALIEFVNSINNDELNDKTDNTETEMISEISKANNQVIHKTKREISDRMRFRILVRDGFRCQTCGRSPITTIGIELHVDHIIPWSKGGETIPENLQCKCIQCNFGKGNAFDV